MKKLISILAMAVLLFSLVIAEDRTLHDTTGIDVPLNIIAGNTFGANFSFKYLDDFSNPDNSPLIIQLNFSSDNESYPVWRNDFKVSGRVEKYALWGYVHTGTVYFECNNSETQVIEHPLDSQTVQADNGTFYCYDEDADLQLEEYDEVYLDVIPYYAIYPGKYNLTASMFYLTDERAPFVEIVNKNVFDLYYRENDNVEIVVTIEDGSEIIDKWGMAFLGYEDLIFPFTHEDFGLYYFSKNTPVDIVEGDYPLFVFAKDKYNNTGNDSVTLKIDRTAPEIDLISPNNSSSVYGDILPINLSVVDVKAGLDVSLVKYRLREMDGTNICPETGTGTWDCYNSDWVNNWELGNFSTEINVSELGISSGEYWLEISACDILDNCGVL